MKHLERLFQKLEETPFPAMGKRVGHFPLYDSYLAGYASSVIHGKAPPEPEAMDADEETRQVIAGITAKENRSPEEQEFLDYYALLQEIREAILATRPRI